MDAIGSVDSPVHGIFMPPHETFLKKVYTPTRPYDTNSRRSTKSPYVFVREYSGSGSVKPKTKELSKVPKWSPSTGNIHSPSKRSADRVRNSPKQQTVAPSTIIAQCPVLTPEFKSIQTQYKNLTSTGCTAQFCQAGRMLHTDEPRVGENRALRVVEKEAREFLEELRQEGFFTSDEEFCERLRAVLKEIRTGATDGIIRQDKKQGKIGGNWTQTPTELEFGLRRAWRNSRKCIMRSHCEELKLCDFRSITSSAAMATELIKAISKAFNSGNIQPTVFAFPPRRPDSRGPLIWNNQILAFAGYELDDGSVLGDSMSQDLTKAIIELGWTPPQPKSKWDLLPIVTMADGDVPVIAELPPNLCKLVEIRHPQYGSEFERLDLKWVPWPALSRLGFDIGGVQYTAAPFIGWFMDAEIGVRNLADSFRYNVLPDIVEALGLADGKIGKIAESFEDLPEYERLSMLSRAQNELNYAVHWSFSQAKVNMTDSLTASMKWTRYDDDFKEKNGFRLPADPYWLAPPQGSIIPLWHRGGAPNYQPKPMICKHVQDPIKAWKREKPDWFLSAKEIDIVANLQKKGPEMPWSSSTSDHSYPKSYRDYCHGVPKIFDDALDVIVKETEVVPQSRSQSIDVYYCSAGTLAEKIANKLLDRTKSLLEGIAGVSISPKIRPLNDLQTSNITHEKILLLVASSTGQGEIPANGSRILEICQDIVSKKQDNTSFRYAIYGNGDTRYSRTYNGAAEKIQQQFRRIGGRPIAGGVFHGDTAIQSTAFQSLGPWWTMLQPALQNLVEDPYKLVPTQSVEAKSTGSLHSVDSSQEDVLAAFVTHSQRLDTHFYGASLTSMSQKVQPDHPGSYLLTLDIGNRTYDDLGCIQILPLNSPSKIRRVLQSLGISGSGLVELNPDPERCPSYARFLSEFVDLEAPFTVLKWLDNLYLADAEKSLDTGTFASQSVVEVLGTLERSGYLTALASDPSHVASTPSDLRLAICLSMPLLHTRNYSIASSLPYISSTKVIRPDTSASLGTGRSRTQSSSTYLQILVKPHSDGRFSSTFLTDNPSSSPIKYRLVDSVCGPSLRQPATTPHIIIATGAGFAPVRCLLQRRIFAARQASVQQSECGISLFLGLKPADVPLVTDLLMEAAELGVLDSLSIMPSNEAKVRVYEKLEEEGVKQAVRRKLTDEGGRLFVCTGPEAARATKEVIARVIGTDVKMGLGSRYVEEVF